MRATVECVGKAEFESKKSGRPVYVLHLVEHQLNGLCRVHRALTSKKHYDAIKIDGFCEGFLNFDNGTTTFYLPLESFRQDKSE